MNRFKTLFVKRLLWLTLFSLAMTCSMAVAKTRLSTLELMAGSNRIDVEIAATPELRKLGLMNRQVLPDDHGMLFVFPETFTRCMWMQDTKIPLSAAFIDEHGIIVNIAEMQPDTQDNHCSAKPVLYVIEMRSGWFRQRGIAPGSRINGLDKAPSGR